MVDYVKYREYLNELVRMYRSNKSLAGMSYIAKKYNVTYLNKELFFEFGLHKKDGELTMAETKEIRDAISNARKIRDYEREQSKAKDSSEGFDINSVPEGFELVRIAMAGDYQYALRCDSAIDHANCCMYLYNERDNVDKKIHEKLSMIFKDTVIEVYIGRVPLPCVNGDMDYATLYMVKCANNGTSYFLSSSPVILVGLAWICKSLEKEGWHE